MAVATSTMRGRRRVSPAARGAVCAWALALGLGLTSPSIAEPPTPHPGGFWKCRTSTVKGEFNGEDPVGLAGRAHIPTDCALHWSDGHGKTYCFASNPSFLEFESRPELLDQARAFWAESHR